MILSLTGLVKMTSLTKISTVTSLISKLIVGALFDGDGSDQEDPEDDTDGPDANDEAFIGPMNQDIDWELQALKALSSKALSI